MVRVVLCTRIIVSVACWGWYSDVSFVTTLKSVHVQDYGVTVAVSLEDKYVKTTIMVRVASNQSGEKGS